MDQDLIKQLRRERNRIKAQLSKQIRHLNALLEAVEGSWASAVLLGSQESRAPQCIRHAILQIRQLCNVSDRQGSPSQNSLIKCHLGQIQHPGKSGYLGNLCQQDKQTGMR